MNFPAAGACTQPSLNVQCFLLRTTSVAVDVLVREPLVPVTVKTYEPTGVMELVVIERADEAPDAGFRLKVYWARAGWQSARTKADGSGETT